MTLSGYQVGLFSDPVQSGNRGSEQVSLYYGTGGTATTLADTFRNDGGWGPISRLFASGPIVGDTFRLEVTRTTGWGPRVTEIDALVPESPPAAQNDTYATFSGRTLSVSAAAGVLANDSDPDGDALTVSAVNGSAGGVGQAVATAQGGSVTLNADGSFRYTAPESYAGPDTFDYTASDGHGGTATATVTVNVAAPQLQAGGGVLVGLQGQQAAGVVATFTDSDPSAGPSDFTAQVLWGDGTSSAGSVSAAPGGGFEVTAAHAYAQQGPYALAVQVRDTAGGAAPAVAAGLAAVFDPADHTRFQVVQAASVSGGGSLSQSASDAGGSYSLTASGSFTYTLQSTVRDGLADTVSATEQGSLAVSLTESGLDGAGGFSLGGYGLAEAGGADQSQQGSVADLTGFGSSSRAGSETLTVSKQGDDGTGAFSWSEQASGTASGTATGTYGGDGYSRDESVSSGLSTGFSGDYRTGSYSETRAEGTSTGWAETGHHGGDAYSQSGSGTESTAVSEGGDLLTGGYTLGGTTGFSSALSETGSAQAGGYSLVQTASGSGSLWGSGSDSTRQVSLSAAGTSAVQTQQGGNQLTDNYSQGGGQTASYRQDLTGDESTGGYSLHQVTGGGASPSQSDSNQGDAASQGEQDSSLVTRDETGNTVSGSYSYHQVSGASASTTGSSSDQTASGTSAGSDSLTVTEDGSGNRLTGSYSFHQVTADSYSSSESDGNLGNTDSLSEQDSSLVTRDEAGNTVSGSYSYHQVSGTSAVTADKSSAQTASGTSSGSDSQTVTEDGTGNSQTGAYSFHQVTVALSSSTESDLN